MKILLYKLFIKAFSNKTRLRILELLKSGPKTVSEICKELNFEQSRVSHNLKCLIDCGFVHNNKIGKTRVYYLDKKIISPMLKLIDKHVESYSEHLKKCGIIKGRL